MSRRAMCFRCLPREVGIDLSNFPDASAYDGGRRYTSRPRWSEKEGRGNGMIALRTYRVQAMTRKWEKVKVFKFVRNHKHVAAVVGAVVLLMASAAAALGAGQTAKPVVGMTLHDARGRLMGAVLDQVDDSMVRFAVKVGTRVISLQATREQLVGTAATLGTPLYYASANCSGQPFEGHNPSELPYAPTSMFANDVFFNFRTVYVASGEPQTVHVNSARDESDGRCTLTEFEHFGLPLVELADLGPAPYSIRGITID
jgi:hypothetical protein